MKMNRQMAAITISKVNRLSKQLAYYMDLGLDEDVAEFLPQVIDVNGSGSSLMKFLQQGDCIGLLESVSVFHDTKVMYKYLKKSKLDEQYIIAFNIFAKMVDELKTFVSNYARNLKRGPYVNLTETFSNPEALKVFERVRDAGYLTEEFQLKDNLSKLERAFLAWGIFTTLKLPKRKQWTSLVEQWKIKDRHALMVAHIPEQRTKDMDRIQKVFPELDFSVFINKRTDQFFTVPYDDDRIHELYVSLLSNKYIDPETSFLDFMKIFRRGDMENFTPVKWIQEGRYLSYFVRIALAPTNTSYWAKAKNCFLIRGKEPNLSTLSSAVSIIRRSGEWDVLDPTLKTIAEVFCGKRKM